jgi:hypothetical protein
LNGNQKFVVRNLNPKDAEGAAFDSGPAEERDARCLGSTRVELLRRVDEWSYDPEGKCIFWLQGMAGTGKSTISRTVAHNFAASGRLGASFFFKKGDGDRGKAAFFFTTIAAQLVRQLPAMAEHVRNTIETDPTITEKTNKEQFEKLILEPLRKVDGGLQTPSRTMMVVIDALDECDREKDVTDIISLLSQAKSLTSVCPRFFVTSRPELPILLAFKGISGSYTSLVLHEIPGPVIALDISTFLQFRLQKIRDEYNKTVPQRCRLPLNWPGQEKVEKLVKMTVPLFIFAATACRFIEDRRFGEPDDTLEKILEHRTGRYRSNLDAIYLPTLDQMVLGLNGSARSNAIQEFKNVVGSIVVLASPLSRDSLGRLLGVSQAAVKCRLDLLHSVLNVPSDPKAPIGLLHLSFREFLVNPDNRDNEFWVDEKEAHEKLASRCLQLLSNDLRKDICRLKMPGTLRKDIDKRTIDGCLLPEVQYACFYWIYHLKESKSKIQDGDQAHQFLKRHFLHWLEALSIISRISESIRLIDDLQCIIGVSHTLIPYASIY